MKQQIKHRFTGSIIFECEAETFKDAVELAIKNRVNLSNSNLRHSDFSYSNLRGSDFSYSDLRGSDLRGSNLRGLNLSHSSLRGSNLSEIKKDFIDKISLVPKESINLYRYVVDGKINGSCYEGECACFCGTISKTIGLGEWNEDEFSNLTKIEVNSYSPIERFFLAINKGDTHENNPVSEIVSEWLEEFMKENNINIPKREIVRMD